MPSLAAGIDDPALPAARTLLDGGLADVVRAALPDAAEIGEPTPSQLLYRPGRALTVRCSVPVRWAPGDGPRRETIVVACGDDVPPEARVLVDGGTPAEPQEWPHPPAIVPPDRHHSPVIVPRQRHHSPVIVPRQRHYSPVAVWRLPDDPVLPGLRPALDRAVVRRLLDDLGVPAGTPELDFITYRPARRAVVRVGVGAVTLYLKIVPPGRARALHDTHRTLSRVLPVPDSHGVSEPQGIVVLAGLPGRTLRRALTGGVGALPPPAALTGLLDRLPDPPAGRTDGGWGHRSSGRLLGTVLPDLEERLDRLTAQLDAAEAGLSDALVPVHGDFHEAQLLVDGPRIRGLLDVDGWGRGRRVDDLATCLGHLTTLELSSPRPGVLRSYRGRLLAHFEQQVDPATLRRATAAAVLALATGPLRVLQEDWPAATRTRLGLAEAWARSASRPGATPP